MIDDETPRPLSDEERRELRALDRERGPAEDFEARVVRALAARGLIRRPSATRWSPWTAAAAALLALALGLAIGRASVPTPAGEGEEPRFLLLLYGDPERDASRTPERERELAAEYGAWARELDRAGRFAGGDPLAGEGRMLRRTGTAVESGPEPTAAGEIVVGYFMIRARDYTEALAIAEGCPHLRYDGGVLVRRVGHT